MTTPTRPALRYYGGKWNLAPWIISHFPPHKNYVEPCGGAASVLLQKPRSPLETYNDLDGNVVKFFRVLREQPDELLRQIRLTPWARAEYELSLEPCEGDLEAARRTWVWCWMAIGGKWSGWRAIVDVTTRHGETWPSDNLNIDHLLSVADRFQNVQIEQIDMLDCISRYDNCDALIYFDPPYVVSTRERGGRYENEIGNSQHGQAATLLRNCAGMVIVSGYASPLYADLYEAHGWQRRDREAQTNSGGKRTESIWLSPRTWQALGSGMGLPLFQIRP